MPATRITVAANIKQSQKTPLLISTSTSYDPANESSCRGLVLKTAQSKLRIRKGCRIFVAGQGKELFTEEDWRSALKDDITLLVSAGEDYVGIVKDEKAEAGGRSNGETVPTSVLAERALIDPTSITQFENTARTLPGIVYGVAQPDLHPGNRFPIGAVFVSDGWIHPPLIGGDIGCGMAWYRTTLTRTKVEGDKGRKIAERLRGVEGPWRDQDARRLWLSRTKGPPSERDQGLSAGSELDEALGTIGAGNHFAEVQVVEEFDESGGSAVEKDDDQDTLHGGEVVLLVHSGSRGYGGDILKRFTVDEQTSIRLSDPRAADYLAEHDKACAWASRNRDLIALRFLACLEPGNSAWDLGLNGTSSTPAEGIDRAFDAVQGRKVVDICHNNMQRTHWPPQAQAATPASAANMTVPETFIHRKGAAPISPFISSSAGVGGSAKLLRLLPLPGSRGTPTLILKPTLSAANEHGLVNALSVAHGAGRAMSRAKALASLAARWHGKAEDMLRGDHARVDSRGNKGTGGGMREGRGEMEEGERTGRAVRGGTWVVCEDKALVWEEAPEAYKDVWDVGADLEAKGAARRIGWCRGVVSYKVRKE